MATTSSRIVSTTRPMLEAGGSRGLRVEGLHVDPTNRITWVERDLARPPRRVE